MRSPLTLIGGKGRIVNWVLEHFPDKYDLYIEPFCGAAWVYFAIGPCPAVLNDVNSDIVNFFECLKIPDRRKNLIRMLKYTPYSRELFAELCNKEGSRDTIKRAWKFFCISRMSFSGGGATKNTHKYDFGVSAASSNKGTWIPSSGRFKVGVNEEDGTRKMAACTSRFICPIRELDGVAELLQTAIVEHLDFRKLLNYKGYKKKGSFIYADPPYIRGNKILSSYYGVKWTMKDIEDLTKILNKWSGPVLFSNYAHPTLWDKLFPGKKWTKVHKEISVCSAHSSKGMKKERRTEVLIMNYKPSQGNLPFIPIK